MENVYTPGDAAARLRGLAATLRSAPREQIVVYRMTPEAAAQTAADLEAIAGSYAPPATQQPGQAG